MTILDQGIHEVIDNAISFNSYNSLTNTEHHHKLKDVRAQIFHAQIFFKLATQKGNDLLLRKRQKKLGVTDFVLERTYPEKYPKSEKSGFVS